MSRKTKWTKGKLIDKIKNIVDEIGFVPGRDSIYKYGLAGTTIRCYFKTWNKFLIEAGLPLNKNSYSKKIKIKINCLRCDKEIIIRENENRKFCSSSCAAIFNNKQRRKHPKKPEFCIECGEGHNRDSLFCRTLCRLFYNAKKRTKKDENKNVHCNYTSITNNARTIAKHSGLIDKCRNCDYSKHVETCHIKSISDFSDDATLYEINHPDNLIGLCPNCHWEFDDGQLKLKNIQS